MLWRLLATPVQLVLRHTSIGVGERSPFPVGDMKRCWSGALGSTMGGEAVGLDRHVQAGQWTGTARAAPGHLCSALH